MDDAALLIAELLTRRWLPRSHPRVKRALVDAELFAQVEQRLAQSGLRWMDSIYADHVSVALLSAAQNGVMGESGLNANNNLELPRDAQALLIVLWALIVLPKRERQTSRVQEADAGQNDFFPGAKPLPQASVASPVLSYKALLEDYGPQLGKKLRLDANLKLLERHASSCAARTRSPRGRCWTCCWTTTCSPRASWTARWPTYCCASARLRRNTSQISL